MYLFIKEDLEQSKEFLRWGKDNAFMLRFSLSCLKGKSKTLREETHWKMIFLLDRYIDEVRKDLSPYYQGLTRDQKEELLIDFLEEIAEIA